VWWYTPVILALGGPRQGNLEFKASLNHIVRSYLKIIIIIIIKCQPHFIMVLICGASLRTVYLCVLVCICEYVERGKKVCEENSKIK
jgi:hypothetical protein